MAEQPSQTSGRTAGASSKTDAALASVIERNIAALIERRRREETHIGWQARLADAATRFAGNLIFVYLHLFWFGFWVAINAGIVPLIRPWDPSFAILGTVASVEAIFLATLIQVSLLAEHEVTKIVTLVTAISDHLGLNPDVNREELEELKQDVAPKMVLDKLDDLKG
jgi:uncharacterized membrane protein